MHGGVTLRPGAPRMHLSSKASWNRGSHESPDGTPQSRHLKQNHLDGSHVGRSAAKSPDIPKEKEPEAESVPREAKAHLWIRGGMDSKTCETARENEAETQKHTLAKSLRLPLHALWLRT